MKILVIGNGFDLAHYLPTSYNHFMGVMQAIENLPDGKDKIGFDDLFGELAKQEKLEQKEWYFFDRMKELYALEDMTIDCQVVEKTRVKLKKNSWYAYFKHHLSDIESWIDFETKIGEALSIFSLISELFQEYDVENIVMRQIKFSSNEKVFQKVFSNSKILDIFQLFKFIEVDTFSDYAQFGLDEGVISSISFNERYFRKYKKDYKFSFGDLLSELRTELECFIEIFNIYLTDFVGKFEPKNSLEAIGELPELDIIFSFNYTSTFRNFYQPDIYSDAIKIEFLHGKSEVNTKGLVLGIDDFTHELLREHKAYGFIKYHQKLVKETDYLFLKENNGVLAELGPRQYLGDSDGEIDIYIWGHSLDVSDRDYIEEIFSLNDSIESECLTRVVIYYHNDASRFSMLANLIHILGKDLVERWMKKGWLKFDVVPDIYKLNRQLI
ncbi:MAG: hypothetical protein KGO49_07770 [Gammaproteobacteria bacterium]|nr:hypothetical protein [Gammaproteobacteria bacterium]